MFFCLGRVKITFAKEEVRPLSYLRLSSKVISSMYKKTFLLTKPVIAELLNGIRRDWCVAINKVSRLKCTGEGSTVDIYILLHR